MCQQEIDRVTPERGRLGAGLGRRALHVRLAEVRKSIRELESVDPRGFDPERLLDLATDEEKQSLSRILNESWSTPERAVALLRKKAGSNIIVTYSLRPVLYERYPLEDA